MQPTIAVSEATLKMPEVARRSRPAASSRRQDPQSDGVVKVTKCAIEPVWYLPGIAKRFKLDESTLRRKLFEQTGGMFPELITRTDLSVFLPPIGGTTAIIIGDPKDIPDLSKKLTARVHDECNGSDVFGSDICTCRPYLTHGIEECIKTAQEGGTGLIVYNRKEGRALGEVTKFMVYNARKRQEGGDTAMNYFKRTEMIAGVQDMRFQELMPDPLLWLGVKRIDKFISMSDMKYDAVTSTAASRSSSASTSPTSSSRRTPRSRSTPRCTRATTRVARKSRPLSSSHIQSDAARTTRPTRTRAARSCDAIRRMEGRTAVASSSAAVTGASGSIDGTKEQPAMAVSALDRLDSAEGLEQRADDARLHLNGICACVQRRMGATVRCRSNETCLDGESDR